MMRIYIGNGCTSNLAETNSKQSSTIWKDLRCVDFTGILIPVICSDFIRALPYGGCPIVISASVPNEVFRVFFYTISYRNLKLSMRFF
jgi:hypothetical protein